MPVMQYRQRTIFALSGLVPEIVYVVCGARGETRHPLSRALPQLRFIGFEPDPDEYNRLVSRASPGFTYFNTAVAGRDERRILYVTRNASCSSLLPPNQVLYRKFKDCASHLEVVAQKEIDTVSLDAFLPKSGVRSVDFLHLDTQGTELEILQGASSFLSKSVVGVKCEVEFAPLYEGQPLFGDVDTFLRRYGFTLFDLSRSRYRRAGFPDDALTRGQLLWGDATYLKDYRCLADSGNRTALFKLCLLAAHLQFHDYALEVLEFLLSRSEALTTEDHVALRESRHQYIADLRRGVWWTRCLRGLESLGLKNVVKESGRLATQAGDRLRKDRAMTEYNWID
jgi:FkbM family methyltransferase